MTPSFWLLALGPFALACLGLTPGALADRHPLKVSKLARFAAGLAFALAVGAAVSVAMSEGPITSPLIGTNGIGFSLYVDTLSAVMFLLVSFIGLLVIIYSQNYVAGDPGQGRFIKWLCLTLATIQLAIIAGNVFQFFLAWLISTLALDQLLVFYKDRPAAVLAARKKFIIGRLGDACMIAAMILLYQTFGSLEYSVVFSSLDTIRETGQLPSHISAVAILLVLTALLKSAQFPFHGWLLEVMETPTPVSALLHAGIINAGGFLVLRFSEIISISTPSLEILAIVGGFTAMFGSIVMLTQTSIKVSLAYSTISQMGYMMLECGLGAFPVALLHIVGHSFYKAHAFLSSGSVIDIARASWSPSPGGKPHPARMLLAVGVVLALALIIGQMFGATLTQKPGVVTLGVILLLSVTVFFANAIDERPSLFVVARTISFSIVIAASYFGLEFLFDRLLVGSVPPAKVIRGPLDFAVILLVIFSFSAVVVFQDFLLRKVGEKRWQAVYFHIANGLYINTLANRLVLRFWPSLQRKRIVGYSYNVNSINEGR